MLVAQNLSGISLTKIRSVRTSMYRGFHGDTFGTFDTQKLRAAEWRPARDELGVIVELRPLVRDGSDERSWMVASINAADNAPAPRSIRIQVERKLAALGFFRPVRPTGDEIAACVTRLMRRLDGGWFVDCETV